MVPIPDELPRETTESLQVLGIAHDLGNLLMSILSHLQMARTGGGIEEVAKHHLDEIASATGQASDLCRQLVMCAKRKRAPHRNIQLNELVSSSSRIDQPPMQAGIALRFELLDSLPLLCADAGQLEQVVYNLVSNACEAIDHPRGRVTIRTTVTHGDRGHSGVEPGTRKPSALPRDTGFQPAARGCKVGDPDMSTDATYISLSVIDNGKGIAHEHLPQVFDPFFSTKAPNRGLGLPFVREVVRTHGGFVDVHSEFGQGTTVTIHLPITQRYQPRTPHQQRLKAGAVISPPSH